MTTTPIPQAAVESNKTIAREFCKESVQQSFDLSDERTEEYAKVIAELLDYALEAAAPFMQEALMFELKAARNEIEIADEQIRRMKTAGTYADGIEAAAKELEQRRDNLKKDNSNPSQFVAQAMDGDIAAIRALADRKPEVKE